MDRDRECNCPFGCDDPGPDPMLCLLMMRTASQGLDLRRSAVV